MPLVLANSPVLQTHWFLVVLPFIYVLSAISESQETEELWLCKSWLAQTESSVHSSSLEMLMVCTVTLNKGRAKGERFEKDFRFEFRLALIKL